MKARVKATGEIINIYEWSRVVAEERCQEYILGELELVEGKTNYTSDYWEKLKHQAAISAMQGLLSNERCWEENADKIAEVAICYAKELIKGLKLERSN